nr:coenzyme F430 synthase [Methanobacterium formicicum]
MKVLIVDMTHGGSTLALEFSKRENCEVLAWDIYHTLQEEDRSFLENNHIQLVDDSFYANSGHDNSELVVIAPVHCNLSIPPHMTHHQAVKYLLKNEIKVPVMEITGVKGKTSVVAMLKEIYRDKNPLLLSSRGVEVLFDGEETTLQKNISITPASIITAWRLAQELYKDIARQPDICIFESSLGGTGLADVGIITNIVEDYTIAQGTSSASKAKQQMFASKVVICDHDSYHKNYSLDPATREKNEYLFN